MASSGSFETTACVDRTLTFKWEIVSQDSANNQTTISWQLYGSGPYTGRYVTCGGFKVTIDGEVVYEKPTSYRVDVYNNQVVASGTKTIKHNADGTKTFSASAEAGIYYYAVNCYGNGSWSLTQIPKAATITSAPNFTDEDSPTLFYSNGAGNNVTSLQACISFTGATDDIAYRNIPKTTTTYTFSFTDAERNKLRQAVVGSNSRSVIFFVRTVIGGTTYHSTLTRTLTIVNGNPVISNASVVDTDSTCIALTGDANKLIRYYSDAKVSYTASVRKFATLASQSASNGSTSSSSNPATFSNTSSGTYTITITDNRGNRASQTISKTLINYVKLTCNMNLTAPSAKGNMSFQINGNYFNGSFGAQSNSLTVQYRYKQDNGSYGSWVTVSATKSGNTYKANISLTGLDYRSKYTFQARAVDKLATITTAEQTVRTPPVFDWGEDDFNFNVPVQMNGHTVLRHNEDANNVVLSASGGHIYIRPGGTDDTSSEIRITPQGDIIIGGKSLKSLLGI